MSTSEKFWAIVEDEMDNHDINSYRALESMGNVANGTISARARHRLPPTPTTIQAISVAMNIPSEVVMEWAKGHRPKNIYQREADILFNQLTPEEQEIVLAQMRGILEWRRS